MRPFATLAATCLFLPLAAHAAVPVSGSRSVTCSGRNDTAAINRALALGGQVYLQPGVCAVSGPLEILVSGTTLSGAGMGATTVKALRPDAFNVIEIGPAINGQRAVTANIVIKSVTLDGGAKRGDDTSKHSEGIIVRSADKHVTISRVEVRGMGNSGIEIAGSYVEVSGSNVHDNWHGGIYIAGIIAQDHISIYNADHIAISHNTVAHNSLERPPGWLRLHPGQPAWDGIDADPRHSHVTIDHNLVLQNDILLLDDSTNGIYSGPNSVTDNTVKNSVQSGIDVHDRISGFTVRGNTLVNDTAKSIGVSGYARSGVVSQNTTKGGGGITVSPDAVNVKVTHNITQ